MDETIDSKVEGAKTPSKIGRFFGNAVMYLVVIGAAGGIGAIGKQVYYDIKGIRPVVMTNDEYNQFSEIMSDLSKARHEYLCEQARYIRETVMPTIDKNGDGHITREEVGLPPK
jgi:hypothetical protein